MNLRWLYLSIYLMMTSSITICLFNKGFDDFVSSGLLLISTGLLLAGSRKLEHDHS